MRESPPSIPLKIVGFPSWTLSVHRLPAARLPGSTLLQMGSDDYAPWILNGLAPSWVVAAMSEEHWPERDVAHLLKRLVAEGVDRIELHVAVDGIASLEVHRVSGEGVAIRTVQLVDPKLPRPLDAAIKRAADSIRSGH